MIFYSFLCEFSNHFVKFPNWPKRRGIFSKWSTFHNKIAKSASAAVATKVCKVNRFLDILPLMTSLRKTIDKTINENYIRTWTYEKWDYFWTAKLSIFMRSLRKRKSCLIWIDFNRRLQILIKIFPKPDSSPDELFKMKRHVEIPISWN